MGRICNKRYTKKMKIKINNTEHIIIEGKSLENLIKEKNIQTEGTAIAVNEIVIPKSKWKKIILKENDRILIIIATSGG